MNYNPKINLDRFEASFKAIDAHTAGEFCRIVYSGFPKPEGNTPIERKHWLEKNYNHYRTALMLEPRGHHDMFGAYICEPIDPRRLCRILHGYRRMAQHVRPLHHRRRHRGR